MEEDVLEAGSEALLLPAADGAGTVVGWPLKTIRLNEGVGGGGGNGASASASATLTILVEAARPP
jgi:hypothetical protein